MARSKAKAKSKAKATSGPGGGSPFLGRWDVASVTTRGRPDRYAEAGAFFEFESEGLGRFQIGDVEGDVDYREAPRDGRPAIEFSWEGVDATDLISGRGWAVLDGDRLAGRMLIHLGDESEFVAVRSSEAAGPAGDGAMPEILPMTRPRRALLEPDRAPAPATGLVYRLKITLRGTRPPIWRRIVVPDLPLPDLHLAIQAAMGWQDCHLHEFVVDGVRYSDPETAAELETEIADLATLGQLVTREKAKFRYNYDFGDDWIHDVVVESIGPPEPGAEYPACLGGRRACPPEDSGGPWGYADLAAAIADTSHPEHDRWAEWAGDFDPEAFSVAEANARIRDWLG